MKIAGSLTSSGQASRASPWWRVGIWRDWRTRETTIIVTKDRTMVDLAAGSADLLMNWATRLDSRIAWLRRGAADL